MENSAFDDDTEFFFVKFEDGTSTTMDQEMRKAYATAELEYAAEQLAEQSIAVATGIAKSK